MAIINAVFGDAEQTGEHFKVNSATPPNWGAKRYINTYRDQHGRIVYDWREIEAAFVKYGPTKMRDGRKRNGVSVIDIVIPEVVEGGEER